LDNLPESEKVIAKALEGRRPNSLLLDLAAQVAIARHNYTDAESYIDRLRRVRADVDFHHRFATLLNAKKQFRDALPHAEAALKTPRPRFELEATLADTLIEVREFDRATELLDQLEQRGFANDKRDVRLGLRCKLLLRQGKWKQAEDIWGGLAERTRPVDIALRIEILQQKVADLTTTPGVRAEAAEELARLRPVDASDQISLFSVEAEPEDTDGDDETPGL
jgi:thioredoxin-like negative regulator of GroEL